MLEKTKTLLENVQASYKLIYTIIMSVPLIIALENLLLSENKSTGVLQIKSFGLIQLSDLLLFIVFILMFARFFLGDLRLIDKKYLELQYEVFQPRRYKPISRFVDFFNLIIHAIFFYMLAASLLNFLMFYIIFTFILFFNAFWLITSFYLTPRMDRQIVEIQNTLKWVVNNISHGLLLISYLLLFNGLTLNYSIYIFFILGVSNSIIDFIFTKETYFPKIE